MNSFELSAAGEMAHAFVPIDSNPFVVGNELEPNALTFGIFSHAPEAMPIIPELSSLMVTGPNARRQIAQLGNRSAAVLQPLANELAPTYPQIAKVLTEPALDEAIQSGSELLAHGLQAVESTIESGQLVANETTQEVSRSARELANSLLERWNAADNALHT